MNYQEPINRGDTNIASCPREAIVAGIIVCYLSTFDASSIVPPTPQLATTYADLIKTGQQIVQARQQEAANLGGNYVNSI
jgi:hypothetical protein